MALHSLPLMLALSPTHCASSHSLRYLPHIALPPTHRASSYSYSSHIRLLLLFALPPIPARCVSDFLLLFLALPPPTCASSYFLRFLLLLLLALHSLLLLFLSQLGLVGRAKGGDFEAKKMLECPGMMRSPKHHWHCPILEYTHYFF